MEKVKDNGSLIGAGGSEDHLDGDVIRKESVTGFFLPGGLAGLPNSHEK